jgi:molybdopterin-guanine dinucleotide biosynthesis protein A
VLAGGASLRFGSDKALARIGGRTVLERMCDLLTAVTGSVTVIAPPARYSFPKMQLLADRWPGEGPLGGILTALRATAKDSRGCEWNLIVSCDMPFLSLDWLNFVIERARKTKSSSRAALGMTDPGDVRTDQAEVIVPKSEHGLEPLCACWKTSAVGKLQSVFDEGVRKVTEAMKRLHMEVLDEAHWKRFDSAGQLFWNMNTQQDYEEAVRAWGRRVS